MKITFHGAAQTVTGSRHLIELENGKQLLLDGGLFQGHDLQEIDNLNRHLGFDPAAIDYVILSHAHMDHSGNIPKLVKEGFRGTVFTTPPTKQLCGIMFLDSAYIQKVDIKKLNDEREKEGRENLKPIYNKADVRDTMSYFKVVEYNQPFKIDENFSFEFLDAGHILGSAMVDLSITENGSTKKLCFTGDLGRPVNSLLNPPHNLPQSDIMICESTYGDRLHDPFEETEDELLEHVVETCTKKGGKLLIPAFSLGRSQEVVLALEKLYREKKLPPVEVFVDSPLALKATNITFKFPEYLNPVAREYLNFHDDPLGFPNLHYVQSRDQSRALNDYSGPCIIVSASGMLEGGRIVHHAKHLIGDKKNAFLFVGFATPESLGGKLQAGEKTVAIMGKEYAVHASILKTDKFSAHADYKELLQYFEAIDCNSVKDLFLVHGEGSSQQHLKKLLCKKGISNVTVPEKGATFDLN